MKTTILTSKTATEPKVDLDAEWRHEIIASMFEETATEPKVDLDAEWRHEIIASMF